MFHVATIHWKSDRWIAPQKAFLSKHLGDDHRIYAWLNDVPGDYAKGGGTFHYARTDPITEHAVKLNMLADVILSSGCPDEDVILFLDGDAFPIGDIAGMAREKLPTHKLVAVKRYENHGDIQPHPCFCITTAGFWREIKGDWREGYEWLSKTGKKCTDVGGNLLGLLKDKGINWHPLMRSNGKNLHPLFFGIYGGLVYHHGAGFRATVCRADHALVRAHMPLHHKVLSKIVPGYRRSIRAKFEDKRRAANYVMSEEIFAKIERDPEFYRAFM